MDLNRAEDLALQLMTQYGLRSSPANPWCFMWMRARKTYGLCNHSQRVIYLSRPLVAVNSEEVTRDTILHEIAHAIVGPFHGHDRTWRLQARSMGCSGTRCVSGVRIAAGGWIGHCPNPEHEHRMFRKPTRTYSCGKCAKAHFKSGFQQEYVIEWKRAPRRVTKDLTDTAQ